jgi:hypothetical protein
LVAEIIMPDNGMAEALVVRRRGSALLAGGRIEGALAGTAGVDV